MKRRGTRKGSALVVVFVFMAVFGALAVGYLTAANANLRMSRLYVDSRRAHLAAESGLGLIRQALPDINIQDTEDAAQTLQAIADGLNGRFQDNVFGGFAATVTDDRVTLPAITLNFPEGSSQIHLVVYADSDTDYIVHSIGRAGDCAQTVALSFGAAQDTKFLATFGVASKSRISMTGNTDIQGANDSREGSVLSTTYTYAAAIDLTGNVNISGNVSIANPAGSVRLIGNAEIGGQVKIGVDQPAFPEVEVSVFEPYATNIVDSGTPTSGNLYFENIRILAGSNPTFSGNITIRGVVYIESPNRVRFAGNLNLTGVVVAEEPEGDLDLDNHYIHFTGNSSTNGVEDLPSGAQFDGLRDLGGAFILVPGYEIKFTGNFSTINGSMAASKMKFTGNAGGTIKGSLINYDDTDFVMTGNSHLTINHDGLNTNPPGLIFPKLMIYVGGSYVE